jgi:hypothetical protein
VYNPSSGNPLNEYIAIKNIASKTFNLTDWYIRDDGTNRYDFPSGFTLGGGKTVRVWSSAGFNTATDLYWNSPVEVWNDVNDCAYLRDNSEGKKILIDRYCYSKDDDGIILVIREP